MSSSPPTDDENTDHVQQLRDFIAQLAQHPDREAVASEVEVLQSIYGEDAVRLWHPSVSDNGNGNGTDENNDHQNIRYVLTLSLPSHDDITIRILVSLPPTYPVSSPPQLQLLSRYIGAFGTDAQLFGSILRTYISVNGVEFTPENVCVFDGVQSALERCNQWYQERLGSERVKEIVREDQKEVRLQDRLPQQELSNAESIEFREQETSVDQGLPTAMPAGVEFYIAEPIVDRKSTFIGRACRISDPSQVPQILAHLISDRRISRAAHPIINAWRCQMSNILHQDNDDDGETAAGGRLAHLLQILEVNNVLVVVTRYFGGIHLGPDRFKHINQAARNALELGGFLDAAGKDRDKDSRKRGKKH